jgi:hypothetical protein
MSWRKIARSGFVLSESSPAVVFLKYDSASVSVRMRGSIIHPAMRMPLSLSIIPLVLYSSFPITRYSNFTKYRNVSCQLLIGLLDSKTHGFLYVLFNISFIPMFIDSSRPPLHPLSLKGALNQSHSFVFGSDRIISAASHFRFHPSYMPLLLSKMVVVIIDIKQLKKLSKRVINILKGNVSKIAAVLLPPAHFINSLIIRDLGFTVQIPIS